MSKRSIRTFFAYFCVCALVALATGASAAEDATPQKKKTPFADTPCSDDYDKLCTRTQGWRLGFECLRNRYSSGELSDECKAHTDHVVQVKKDRVKARERAWHQACAKDIQQHCSEFERSMAIKGCLYRIRDQVAPACDEKLPYRPGHTGPGYTGWRDGSEPANYDEELNKRLQPNAGQVVKNISGSYPGATSEQLQQEVEAEAEAEREKVRAEIRARLEANRKAREGASAEAAGDASQTGSAD